MADLRDQSLGFRLRHEWLAYVYLLPTILVLLFLNGYPIAYSVYVSMTDFGTGGKGSLLSYHYVGWSNYVRALTVTGGAPLEAISRAFVWGGSSFLQPAFDLGALASPITTSVLWPLVQNSFFWAAGSVVLFLAVGLGLASILNQQIRAKGVYRTLILVPWAMPAFITIIVWTNMWNYDYGIINDMLHYVGVAPINWLGSTDTAWAALFITNLWLSFPFYTVVFLGVMQAIPHELYEAAAIDGAGNFARFRRITLPFLAPTVIFVGLMGFLFTFNNFYPIFILTMGGPGSTTQIFITQSYIDAFVSAPQYSTAALYGTVDFAILIVLTLVVIWRTNLTRNWLR
jgi:arabinogalactan oligomer / maltooligosaccharide transport system permease protein